MNDDYDRLGYDLCACIEYNEISLDTKSIKNVLAVFEGERDEISWSWILELINGRFAIIIGGCCYTGWDCQSYARDLPLDNPYDALTIINFSNYYSGGLYHGAKPEDVITILREQLDKHERATTWHESKADEFKDIPVIDKLPENVQKIELSPDD